MKRILILTRKHWQIWLLLLLSGLVIRPLLFPGYFSHHDDLQVIRLYEMRRCLTDLQIPCRWTPDMGAGYGFPMFNYYGVFPYILGAVISFAAGYLVAATALFFLPLVLGGLFIYLLVKEIYSKESALLAGILYTLVPYRAVDTYVRGAITEIFALTLIPMVLYFFLKLIKRASRLNFLGASFSFAVFLINHNIFNMIFTPMLLIWLLILILSFGRKNMKYLFISLVLGFALASFFIIPAFFEKNLVQISNLKESVFIPNFRAHFVTLRQLFTSRYWGYGASTWLEADQMSFQVGLPHWVLAGVTTAIFVIQMINKYLIRRVRVNKILFEEYVYAFFIIVLAGSLFMTHNKSAFIWEKISLLPFIQFPWRFLGTAMIAVSILGGLLVEKVGKKGRYLIIIPGLLLTIGLNNPYFKPDKYFLDRTDKDYLTGEIWDYQRRGAISDYLPVDAKEPKTIAPAKPFDVGGEARINDYSLMSDRWAFRINSKTPVEVVVPIFNFSTWEIKVNGQKSAYGVTGEGLIKVGLPAGDLRIEGRLNNTPVRKIGNTVSLISLIGVIYVIKLWKRLKK